MWYLTEEESRFWSRDHGFALDDAGRPAIDGGEVSAKSSLSGIKFPKLYWLSNRIASYLEPFDECLLWVTLWGVWPSSENLHLYYRLRHTYGERRQLADSPGHLFLRHENADLATFIFLAVLFGWYFFLLTSPHYHGAFASHDEYLQFWSVDSAAAEIARDILEK